MEPLSINDRMILRYTRAQGYLFNTDDLRGDFIAKLLAVQPALNHQRYGDIDLNTAGHIAR